MENKINWNIRFYNLAKHISLWSKDTSKGVGAVIVNNKKRIVSTGYNGFPSGMDDSIKERYDRPQKYLYTEHAERNAIYSAAMIGTKTSDCIIYITHFPCSRCTRAIIQSGIIKVFTVKPNIKHKRWGEDFKISEEMLNECGIIIEYLD